MNQDFSRTLTLLRKERGLSQKSVANSLGVSQALLSHYEKGVRECGLNFVVKCADFYDVSCDYLLGRSAEKNGNQISVNEIPDSNENNDKKYISFNIITTLNKKLLFNSLTIIFDMLSKCQNNDLVMEVSYFLMISIYKIFRILHMATKKNNSEMFKIPEIVASGYADASIKISENKIISMIKNKPVNKLNKLGDDKINFDMTTETLHSNYSNLSSSLFNLIKNSEQKINDTIKSD